MASSYSGSGGSTSFIIFCSLVLPDNSITHPQIKHIWVYLVYMATTETPKLEDIDIIICICAKFLALHR